MKISKSLFKELTRCHTFWPLYQLYNQKDDLLVNKNKEINQEDVKEILKNINLNLETDDDALEILGEMFDSSENLLKKETIQLDTFLDTFNEIESLAAAQLKRSYDGTFIHNKDTFKQKKFEQEIGKNNYYCYIDIYNETPDLIRIFEVKSTTDLKFKDLIVSSNNTRYSLFNFNKEKSLLSLNPSTSSYDEKITKKLKKKYEELFNPFSSCGKYIYDIAIQKYIVENTHPRKNVEYYLVVLNSDYLFDGTYENGKPLYQKDKFGNELFTIIDVNKIVDDYFPIIDEKRINLEKIININILDKIIVGKHCDLGKTTECPFKIVCFKKALTKYSILETPQKNYAFNDYLGLKHPTIYDFINNGIYMFTDAYPYTTKTNYKIIYDAITKDLVHLDKDRIKEGLKKITYPIYHLDFESMNNPLPRFSGEKAYSQSVFQYSLHIEKKKGVCDLENDHTEFLAKDHFDHREELIKQLINDIDLSNGGTVLVYNESFEKTRLKELAKIFPSYKKELMNIHDHIVDLLQIIRGTNSFYGGIMPLNDIQRETYAFYHKELHGSFSIKKMLPIFTDLSYKDLNVHNGTEAVLVYNSYDKYTALERDAAYQNLLVYCRQDTWSMVEILRGLNKLIGGN